MFFTYPLWRFDVLMWFEQAALMH